MNKGILLLLIFIVAAEVSAQLPRVILKNTEGKNIATDTISNAGRPIIIDFFATWCKPCNRELDAISEVYAEWQKETGVRLVAVSIDQAHNVNKVKPLKESHGWEFDVLIDPRFELKKAMGVQMVPYTVILDGNGKIVYKHNGYTDGAEIELIDKVRQIIKQ